MRQKSLKHILFPLVIALFAISCNDENGSAPNVSKEPPVKLDTRRFDQDIARIDTTDIGSGLAALKTRYPDFLDFWLDDLMQFEIRGNYANSNPNIATRLRTFLTYKDYRGLFDTVAAHFPDTRQIEEPLTKGFQYYRHYYPKAELPKIVYFISGLNNWSVVTVDSNIVGIGLDMYLGPSYPFYAAVQIPSYMFEQLRPEVAPVNVFKAIYQQSYPLVFKERTLIDMMVQQGKQQYFLAKMLPFVPEEHYLGYTPKQLEWCRANEATIYNFFVKASLLYEKDWSKVLRYVNDGPQTPGMAEESPGNIGSWLGARIVHQYMSKHADLPMDSLFANNDAQAILQEAQYKPR